MRFSAAPVLLLFGLTIASAKPLPETVRFLPGPANGLQAGRSILIYGDPSGKARDIKHVLLTHARRDVLWAASAPLKSGAAAIVPQREKHLFERPQDFWTAFEKARFHDYAQTGTKVPYDSIPVARAVSGGETLDLDGFTIQVLDTPGYTPGAVSYLLETEGTKIACTGDLIYGDGQLFDLYSLQDAVPEANARGYHGYASRAEDLIASLRKIGAAKPDILVPVRGPLIHDPAAAIGKLISRLQSFLKSHYETDALRWYWGEDNLRIRSRAVEHPLDIMPMADQRKLPEWVIPIGNSRLILSASGRAFVVDAGYRKLLPELQALQKAGRFHTLDGIWITHYHDDHTDYVNQIAKAFQCPVYFIGEMKDILENPARYRMPCLTTESIRDYPAKRDGEKLRWNEFEFTFWYFPGQTMYHGGLLARRDQGEALLFVGDSFTPSGMDDYCMQNRNIIREGTGYLYCLDRIASLKQDAWLINQHVEPMFQFSEDRIVRMKSQLGERAAILRDLAPWPDPNYALDESWARVYPYGAETASNSTVNFELRIFNHSPKTEAYSIHWNLPAGWEIVAAQRKIAIPAHREGAARVQLRTGGSGLHIVTADVSFNGRLLREWTEAMIRVR